MRRWIALLGGVAVAALNAGCDLSSDAEAQTLTSGDDAGDSTPLLEAGGRTIGGPGIAVTHDATIFSSCRQDSGGVVSLCAPLDLCVSVVNVSEQPVSVGLRGPSGTLVSVLEMALDERSTTTCARAVSTVEVNPTSGEVQGGGSATELHWRVDVMPSAE